MTLTLKMAVAVQETDGKPLWVPLDNAAKGLPAQEPLHLISKTATGVVSSA